jgi:hypothetical protein
MKSKDGQSAGRAPDLLGREPAPHDKEELVLRDLERKRTEIDAAIASILSSRPI